MRKHSEEVRDWCGRAMRSRRPRESIQSAGGDARRWPRVSGFPADHDIKLVLVDEQRHERTRSVLVKTLATARVVASSGEQWTKPSSASDAGEYGRSGKASQSSSGTT